MWRVAFLWRSSIFSTFNWHESMPVIYDYSLNNPEVNNPYSTVDHGSISSAVTQTEDIGSVSDPNPTFDFFDDLFGFISITESISPFGVINISTSATSAITISQVGSGSIPTVGVLNENIIFTWVGFGTVFEIANGLERVVNPYVASGTLRMDQTVAETALKSVTYDYNESSISPGNVQNYGSVSNSASEILEDYGLVSQTPDVSSEDYVFIDGQIIEIVYPFGQISLNGSALTQPNYRLYFDGNAIVKVVYSESFVGLLTFSGVAVESFSAQTPEDTQLFSISGSLIEKFSAQTPDDTQLFSISGSLVEKNTESYNGLGIVGISGAALVASIDDYIASGILFGFGEKLESRSYIYNESSIEDPIEDSGSITSPTTSFEDYGFIVNSPTSLIQFGLVLENPSEFQYPFGSLAFSGIASTKEIQVYGINPGNHLYPGPTDTSSGIITITNTPLVHPFVDYTPHYGIEKNIGIGTTAFVLTGACNLQASFAWLGTGSLFGQDFGRENRTYVYNEFAVVDEEDWQLITLSPTEFDDSGFISNVPNNFENYGSIVGGNKPFGTINVINGFSPQESYPWLPAPGVGRSWNYTRGEYIGDKVTYTLSGISSNREIQVYGQDYVTSGTLTLSGSLIESDIDSYVGIGTLTFSGTALEALSAQTPENTQLFSISGTALEAYSAQTPEDTQLFTISGSAVEKNTESYVGVVTLTLSETLVEKNTESYVGVGTLTLSGTAIEKVGFDTPEDTQLFSISGTALEAYSAQTPEDTQLFSISGSLVEKNTESYVGLGTLTLSGTAIEKVRFDTPENTPLFVFTSEPSYNLNREYRSTPTPPPITLSGELVHPNIDYTPHYGIEKNIGIGTTGIRFVPGVGFEPDGDGNPRDAKTYSNRYGFLIGDFNFGSGIGTFKFDQTNDTAKYSPLTPYTGTGLFNIITGFSPKDTIAYPGGPGVGKSWSFTRTTYIASGVTTISGISSDNKIQVYGYYGNDNNPGTSGSIFISEQTSPIIILTTKSYVGIGTNIISGVATLVQSYSYLGSGTLTISGTGSEIYSANIPENTQLFSISGTSLEVYSAQTPEIEVLYIISGTLVERKTNSYDGSGSAIISGSATTRIVPNYPARGIFRFATSTVDNIYDTCDDQELTCDKQDSASVSFVVNPVENTVLFNIGGIASTRELATYENIGIGTHIISGSVSNIKLTYSKVGLGTIFTISSSLNNEVDTHIGFGTLLTLSGSAEVYSAQTPESTILLSIGGSSITRIELDYSVVGIGIINIHGTGSITKITSYTQIGSGLITISGQLVHPDIVYIPSPDGSGSISIVGFANNSLSRIYKDISGNLFKLSSGFESFSRSTYTGLGTIYSQEIIGITTNNPFQIPRIYTVII